MVRAIAFLLLLASSEGLRIAPEVQKKVALVVPLMPKSSHVWHDVFGVFGLSAKKAFEKSDWDMTLIALASDDIDAHNRELLESYGFKVMSQPNPVPESSVRTEQGRQSIKSGCCGDSEMMKLYGSKMTEYQKVIVSDADVLFLDNIDELLNKEAVMQATYDHDMDTPYSAVPPVQGGFVVITPNEKDFHEMVETAQEGDFSGKGWRGSGVGYAWGGYGPQGLWAYHYSKDALSKGYKQEKHADLPGDMTPQSPDSNIVHLDRSKYNVLLTNGAKKLFKENPATIKDIKTFHFAGECLKPWDCQEVKSDVCLQMTRRWWADRKELAAKHPNDKEAALKMQC